MVLTLLNTGLATYYRGRVIDVLAIDQVEDKIRNIYSGSSAKPITSSFPDTKSIIIPEANTQVIARDDKLITTVQLAVTHVDIIDKQFLDLTSALIALVNLPVESHTAHFSFVVTAEDKETIPSIVANIESMCGLSTTKVPKGAELLYALPEIAFSIGDTFYVIEFEIEPSSADRPMQLRISGKVHLKALSPISFDTLLKAYSEHQNIIVKYIYDMISAEEDKSHE